MKKVIDVRNYESEINFLERVHYETKARESIINFMIQNEQDTLPQYTKFWDEYVCYTRALEIAKEEFLNNCIINILGYRYNGSWSINFDTKEVTINERCN